MKTCFEMWWSNVSSSFQNKALIYLFVLGVVFGGVSYLVSTYVPFTLLADKLTELSPNSFAFTWWKNPPYDIVAKLYLFNVTNAEKFLNYEQKLRFNEIGPYTYREIMYNANVSFEDNGTITFTPYRKFEFVPELSVGDPLTDTFLLPNVPLLGITASLEDSSMIVKLAVAQIAFVLDSKAFVNLTVDEYLFGYDDVLITLANNVVPNWIDFSRFGIVDRLMALDNGSITFNMPVNRNSAGQRNATLYSIEKFNGFSGLLQWGYDAASGANNKCNSLKHHFVGTVFPPRFEKNSSFVLYRHGFCRSLPLKYNGSDSSKYGFDADTYEIDKNFLSRDESIEDDCYCVKKPCLPNGVGYISPCYYDIPVAISQPHFLNADPLTRVQIHGMMPDPAKHDFYIMINPQSGLPLEAKLRLQINLCMSKTKYNHRIKPFNNLIIPLFWVDLSVDEPPTIVFVAIYTLYVILPNVQQFVKYALMFLSVVLTLLAIFTFLCFYVYKYRNYIKVSL